MTEKIRKKLEVPKKTWKNMFVLLVTLRLTINMTTIDMRGGFAIKLATKHHFNIYFNF